METLFKIILAIHITGGTLALLTAPVSLIVHKGNKVHRTAGKVFLWGMTAVFFTAVYMSIAHNIPFLFMIAFFSFQLVMSGYRALYYKKLHKKQAIQGIDYVILIIAAVVNVVMIGWGIWQFSTFKNTLGIVSIIFGSLGLRFAWGDFTDLRKGTKDTQAWLFKHISGMIGGYIAAITAFLVVNFSDKVPTLVVWLTPTVIGVPLIVYFISYYKKKLAGGKPLREMVMISQSDGQVMPPL